MKLTEKQLAQMFQTETQKNTSASDASDCLNATAASSNRLNHTEELLNDYSAAQSMKLAMSLQDWSDIMADSIEASKKSWFSFLGMSSPLKTAGATMAFAMVLVFALPELNKNSLQSMHVPIQHSMSQSDVIKSIKFEGPGDKINQGGFDQTKDNNDGLFNTSFG